MAAPLAWRTIAGCATSASAWVAPCSRVTLLLLVVVVVVVLAVAVAVAFPVGWEWCPPVVQATPVVVLPLRGLGVGCCWRVGQGAGVMGM